jgi:hypothetical protein
MHHLIRRAIHAHPELTAELWRRGMFGPDEKSEILRHCSETTSRCLPLGPVRFAALLAQGDTVLSAQVVLRDLLTPDELRWLDRLLRFRKCNGKRDELARIVERAIEGRKGKCSKALQKSPKQLQKS